MESENEGNERKERTPIEEIFEEMQRKMDEMMDSTFEENLRKEKGEIRNPKNIEVNFSMEKTGEKPVEIRSSLTQQRKPKETSEMLDVIDKGDKVSVLMEIKEELEKDEIETKIENNKLVIKTPERYKECPIAGIIKEIKEKNYKNNILEVKIEKEKQDSENKETIEK